MYKGPKKIVLEDIMRPMPNKNELLIKVRTIGICGSDFEGYLGKTGRRIPPMIMGHEFSGEIEKIGNNSKFKKGDRVVIYPKLYCGKCNFCNRGLTNLCPNSEFLGVLSKNGGMVDYITINEEYVFKVNKNIPFKEASLVEPLAVAYNAVNKIKIQDLQNSKYLLIIGAGTIGLLILQLLKLKKVGNIIISDLYDCRLEKAKELRADFIINPKKNDFFEEIKKITKGNLVDYSFEAVGFSVSASQSLEILKPGGTAVWVGNAQKIIEINMQKIVTNEINIKGNYIYTKEDFANSLKLVENRKINFESIISLEEKFENGVSAFKKLEQNKNGEIIKIVLINNFN